MVTDAGPTKESRRSAYLWVLFLAVAPWLAWLVPILLGSVAGRSVLSNAWVLALILLATVLAIGYELWFKSFAKRIVKNDRRLMTETRFHEIFPPPAQTDKALEDAWGAFKQAASDEQAGTRVKAALEESIRRYVASADKPPTIPDALGPLARATVLFAEQKQKRFDRITYILDRLQSRISDEYSDIASRTNWLMSGQAFLLAAFVAALNASGIGEVARHSLSTGIACSGAVVSFVLAVSTFLGHALLEELKNPRDGAEKIALDEFAVPRAGVPTHDLTHVLGHAATRYLPSFAYIGWSLLTLLALTNAFGAGNRTENFVLLPNEGSVQVQAPLGWVRYKHLSPAFGIGAWEYETRVAGCPDHKDAAKDWVTGVVQDWKGRPAHSNSDGLVVIGSADRINLSEAARRRMDSNLALARRRADTIKSKLIEATKDEPDITNIIRDERVVVLVTGPQATLSRAAAIDCNDPALSADRSVQVWLPTR
ncbi:MAG TPA: hypothetical protein VE907_17265 [Gammaproteobacteria bacterium]|nr:hypothetical protein [Gammaproteobacteria bacterium]